MFDSLALLMSDAYQALGSPKREHLDPKDLARAAFKTMAFFGLDSQHSEYGRMEKHVTFEPPGRDFLVTNYAPDILLPTYIERRAGNSALDEWVWAPLIRHSALEERRGEGPYGSVYREEDGLHILLSYEPAGYEHRLWYYTDPVVPGSKDDPLPLPTRFGFMFSAQTVLYAVPMMLMRAAKLPEEQQLTTAQLQAINAAVGDANAEIARYEPAWTKEKVADRNPQGRNRRPILGGWS